MKVDIYKTRQSNTFVAVPAGAKVPEAVAENQGVKELFKSAVGLDDGVPRIGMNSKQVSADVEKDGFAVFGAAIHVSERVIQKK